MPPPIDFVGIALNTNMTRHVNICVRSDQAVFTKDSEISVNDLNNKWKQIKFPVVTDDGHVAVFTIQCIGHLRPIETGEVTVTVTNPTTEPKTVEVGYIDDPT